MAVCELESDSKCCCDCNGHCPCYESEGICCDCWEKYDENCKDGCDPDA
jgi:hypothetical protein